MFKVIGLKQRTNGPLAWLPSTPIWGKRRGAWPLLARSGHTRDGEVRKVPIVLKKSFLGDERNFLGPLMRFVRGDVRDHIVSHKSDHGPSYQRYGALQL
jgi:hypothetical protein